MFGGREGEGMLLHGVEGSMGWEGEEGGERVMRERGGGMGL